MVAVARAGWRWEDGFEVGDGGEGMKGTMRTRTSSYIEARRSDGMTRWTTTGTAASNANWCLDEMLWMGWARTGQPRS